MLLHVGGWKECELLGYVDGEGLTVPVGVEHVLLVSGLDEHVRESGEPRGELTCTVTGPGPGTHEPPVPVPVEINVDEKGSSAELKLTPVREGPLHCRIQFGGHLITNGEFTLTVRQATSRLSSHQHHSLTNLRTCTSLQRM